MNKLLLATSLVCALVIACAGHAWAAVILFALTEVLLTRPEPRCCTVAAIGIGVAAVGAGVAGGVMSANAQEDAAAQNAKNVQSTNDYNYMMFRQARGAKGNAVLPIYLKGPNGDSFESILGNQFVGDWTRMMGDINPNTFASNDTTGAARSGASRAVSGIFNGDNEAQQLANLAPVAKARTVFSRQSAMDALNKTLGEIDAAQSGRGFTGDSSGNQLLRFNANKAAGDASAAANLLNLSDIQTIHNTSLAARVANANLPFNMQRNEMSAIMAPREAYFDAQLKAMQPLSFLRIGGGQPFVAQNMPTVQPVASAGQLAMQGVAGVGNTALSYWMQQQQLKQLQGMIPQSTQGGGGGSAAPYGYNAATDPTNPINNPEVPQY